MFNRFVHSINLFFLFFSATLNILTEDAQWTYLLKGSYPDNSFHSGPLKSKPVHAKR